MILLVAAAATLVAIQGGRPKPVSAYVGKIFPPLDAGGWINTKAPLTAEDLRGKIVLVDFWASDCLPCIRALPELIEFQKRFRDRVTIALEAHVARLQASIPTLAHQERPDYLDRIAMLRDQVFVLDHMYMSVFSTAGWIDASSATVTPSRRIHPIVENTDMYM